MTIEKNTFKITIDTSEANKALDELLEKARELRDTMRECGCAVNCTSGESEEEIE